MIEVEIKVRITDPELMRKCFIEEQGIYKFSLTHEDTYFNMPNGLRDFKKTDEALRLRKSVKFIKNNKGEDPISEVYFTYKGKKLDTSTKTREEIDLLIEDYEKMKRILSLLGFIEVLSIKKEREFFKFDYKNYSIEALIDFLPILNQYFIEVEYLTESSVEVEEIQNLLFEFLNLFGIKREDSVRKSYLELVIENLKV